MKTYNKLVRDKIPEIIKADGLIPHTRILVDDNEYLESLLAKLNEEALEVRDQPSLDELADVLEVIYTIGNLLGFPPKQIENARIEKAALRGGFTNRIYLENTSE